jgi:hypothetical protein
VVAILVMAAGSVNAQLTLMVALIAVLELVKKTLRSCSTVAFCLSPTMIRAFGKAQTISFPMVGEVISGTPDTTRAAGAVGSLCSSARLEPATLDSFNVASFSAVAGLHTNVSTIVLCCSALDANQAMRSPRPISGHTWAAIQHGLTELLVSPAAKRRVAIEVKAPGPDTDEVRAVAMIGTYKSKLKPV